MDTKLIRSRRQLLAEATLFVRVTAIDIKKTCVVHKKVSGDTGFLCAYDRVMDTKTNLWAPKKNWVTILCHKTRQYASMRNSEALANYEIPVLWKKTTANDRVFANLPLFEKDLNACAEIEQFLFDNYAEPEQIYYANLLDRYCVNAGIPIFRAPPFARFDCMGQALSLW